MMQDLETEEPVAQVNYTGRHIPGMGAPPPYNISFDIPPDLLHNIDDMSPPTPTPTPTAQVETEAVAKPKAAPTTDPQLKRLVYNWASMLHLSGFVLVLGIPFLNILLPTALWLWKKEDHPFLARNGREVINFQITYTFIQLVCLTLGTLFIYFAPNMAASLFSLTKPWRAVFSTGMHLPFNIFTIVPFFWACVMMLRGIVSAYHGIYYKYPVSQDFIFEAPKQNAAQE